MSTGSLDWNLVKDRTATQCDLLKNEFESK